MALLESEKRYHESERAADRLKRLEASKRAAETEQKELLRACLRIAVRYLRRHEATSALHAIAEHDPYLTTEVFTDPERFTPEERREAARLARVEHEHEEESAA
jgi:hypothetical protein